MRQRSRSRPSFTVGPRSTLLLSALLVFLWQDRSCHSLTNHHVQHSTTQQLFLSSLGRDHVQLHFPNEAETSEGEGLRRAIEHEEEMGGLSHVGCTTYDEDGLAAMRQLVTAGIPAHVSFTSARERTLCFVLSMNEDEKGSRVLKSLRPKLSLLSAIPSVLKIEESVVQALNWIESNAASAVTSEVGERHHPHPILNDIASGENVSISIVFREDWYRKLLQQQPKETRREVGVEEMVNEWSRGLKLQLEYSADASAVWNRFYWTNQISGSFSEIVGSSRRLTRDNWRRWRGRHAEEPQCSSQIQAQVSKPLNKNTNTLDFDVGAEVWSSDKVHCLAYFVALASSHAAVSRIALSRPFRLLNDLARGVVQSGRARNEPFSEVGLDGTGQIVGIADTGVDENSCFFRDDENGFVPVSTVDNPRTYPNQRKIVQYLNYSGSGGDIPGGHGSHVAASVAGDCIDPSFPLIKSYNGMAPGAKIAFFDIMDNTTSRLYVPSDLAKAMFRTAYSGGARLYSNSWGGSFWYDAFAIEVDDFSYKNPDFLAIFSAGNDGMRGSRSILSPAMSKNAVAVGASITGHNSQDDVTSVPNFSAKGPSPDGRIKPDVIVPGASIFSAKSNRETRRSALGSQSCAVEPKTGTSMAAPICAGHAALIRQYFADPLFWHAVCNTSYPLCRNGAFSPTGSLVKAMLLHAGTDLKFSLEAKSVKKSLGNAPDFIQGYGRVNLGYSLPLVRYNYQQSGFDLFVDTDSVQSFTELVYEVHVLESIVPLRATLCWYDPPNEEFAARFLLHDLDLVLVDPSGGIQIFGNSLDRSGNRVLGAQRDELNTNEQVTVTTPAIGKWLVRVQGKLLSQTSVQNFALAMTLAGYVVKPAHSTMSVNSRNDGLVRLDPQAFQTCHSSPFPSPPSSPGQESLPIINVDLALWSLVSGDGWNPSDKFSIISEAGQEQHTISSTFVEKETFGAFALCIYPGCYEISLNYSADSRPGTLMTVPICDEALFSPMSPRQTFCFSAVPDPHYLGVHSVSCSKKVTTPPGATQPKNQAETPLPLKLVFAEEAGAGWEGGFISVFSYPLQEKYVSGGIVDSAAQISRMMEWGFERSLTLTLPSVASTCHMMKLSLPRGVEAQPLVFFDNASTLISETNRNYSLNSAGHAHVCPFYINVTNAFAKICAEEGSHGIFNVDTSIYHSNRNESWALRVGADVGHRASWQEYLWATSRENLTFVGICRQTVNFSASASVYSTPVAAPVSIPTPTILSTNHPSPFPHSTGRPSAAHTTIPSLSPVAHNASNNINSTSSASSVAASPLSRQIMALLIVSQVLCICCVLQWLRGPNLRVQTDFLGTSVYSLLFKSESGSHARLADDSGHSSTDQSERGN